MTGTSTQISPPLPTRTIHALWLGMLALSACTLVGPTLPPTLVESELTTPFVTAPTGRAWVQVPGAVLVTERALVNSLEQRIGLPNATAVPGDNLIMLRARVVDGQQQGRFRLDEFRQRLDGLPAPFAALNPGDLFTETDDLGPLFWAEERVGTGTVCVLALRRLDSTTRRLPGNTNVMDMMLRNCVNGEADQALGPIRSGSLGGWGPVGGAPILLSPLAGPTP